MDGTREELETNDHFAKEINKNTYILTNYIVLNRSRGCNKKRDTRERIFYATPIRFNPTFNM